MKKLSFKTDFIFLVIGILAGIATISTNRTFDINLFDAFYIITPAYLATGIFMFYLICSLIYFSFRVFSRPLKATLGLFHLLGTTLSFMALVILALQTRNSISDSASGVMDFQSHINYHQNVQTALLMTVGIWALSQIIFLLNISRTLLKQGQSRS